MNADDEQEAEDGQSQPPEMSQEPPRAKLRDLRPEKDPIGAGTKTTPGRAEPQSR